MEMKVHILKKTLACLTAAGLLFSLAACGGQQAQEAAVPAEAENLILVKTEKPAMGELTQSTNYIGTVEPDRLVEVMPKMGGTVNGVFVEVGDTVTAGQPLMSFDTTDLQVSLAAQKASVEVARAAVMSAQAQVDQSLGSTFDLNLAQLESSVQQAKNAYASARQSLRDYDDNNDTAASKLLNQRNDLRDSVAHLNNLIEQAQTDRNRLDKNDADYDHKLQALNENIERLTKEVTAAETQLSMLNSNVNDDDLDATLRNLRTSSRNAQLAYDSAQTIYELTKNDVRNDALKVANASLGQAAASYDAQVKAYEAQAHQLTFASVTSPIDGIVEAVNITENQTIGNGTIMFTVTNKADLVATFFVSEDAAKTMNLGDPITVENGRNTYQAAVAEIGTMVDANGLFKIKATLAEGANLMSGVSVKITASTAKAQGLLIPQGAIYYDAGQGYVYAYENGKAVRHDITVGVSNNDYAEVIEGIDANTDLITTWNPNLRDGAEVSLSSNAGGASSETANTSSSASAPEASSEAASSEAASSEAASEEAPAESSTQEDAAQ